MDQLMKISTDSSYRNIYETRLLVVFWISWWKNFPQLRAKAIMCLLHQHFSSQSQVRVSNSPTWITNTGQDCLSLCLCLTTALCPGLDKLSATHQTLDEVWKEDWTSVKEILSCCPDTSFYTGRLLVKHLQKVLMFIESNLTTKH